jgi:hypothetical protein
VRILNVFIPQKTQDNARNNEGDRVGPEGILKVVVDTCWANIGTAYDQRHEYNTLSDALDGYYENALATLTEQGFDLFPAALLVARQWPVSLREYRRRYGSKRVGGVK